MVKFFIIFIYIVAWLLFEFFLINQFDLVVFPLHFVVYIKTNCTPYDFADGESECVPGYNVEYFSAGLCNFFYCNLFS